MKITTLTLTFLLTTLTTSSHAAEGGHLLLHVSLNDRLQALEIRKKGRPFRHDAIEDLGPGDHVIFRPYEEGEYYISRAVISKGPAYSAKVELGEEFSFTVKDGYLSYAGHFDLLKIANRRYLPRFVNRASQGLKWQREHADTSISELPFFVSLDPQDAYP